MKKILLILLLLISTIIISLVLDRYSVTSIKERAEQGDAQALDRNSGTSIKERAEQGLASAQYNLGLMYDNGEGVLEDDVTAYAWYNIAAANGGALAKKNKGIIAKEMTPDQIAKAQELSKEMVKKNPKLLK